MHFLKIKEIEEMQEKSSSRKDDDHSVGRPVVDDNYILGNDQSEKKEAVTTSFGVHSVFV